MLINAIRGGLSFAEIIIYIISSLAVIFITMPIHEFAHGFVATRLGDPTPRWQGRLTLNPLAHIDYMGAAAILLFGIGWARPVSVNPRYFKNPKRGMAITAIAGPVANVLLAFMFMLLYGVLGTIMKLISNVIVIDGLAVFITYVMFFFTYVAQISIYLAVFNLIPVPPFDGSRILFSFLPEKYYFKMMQYERYIVIGLFALLYVGVLDKPLSAITSVILDAVITIALFPFQFIA